MMILMKKIFSASLIITKVFLLVIFSGMHFFQMEVLAQMPCHMNMITENSEKNIFNNAGEKDFKNKKNCNICKDSKNILSQELIFCSELKEKKVLKNNFEKFLNKNFSENNLAKKLFTLKLRKNNSPPFLGIFKNYLSFKKSVQLRV